MPTCTGNGVEAAEPLETIRFTVPVVAAKPETASDVAVAPVTMSGVPPSVAVDSAVKPVPVTVAVKDPSANAERTQGRDDRGRVVLQNNDCGTLAARACGRHGIGTRNCHRGGRSVEAGRGDGAGFRAPGGYIARCELQCAAEREGGGRRRNDDCRDEGNRGVLVPPGPVAVTVSVPVEVVDEGAV